ncbi:MAG: leucine-rich repeat protein [Clostridia bacterium]|nr:leucine-rich repeat protein [Clostridia bacterium]
MVTINIKPKNNEDVDKKPRVWFTCHPDDFDACFEIVCRDIFKTHDCAIYYTEDMSEKIVGNQKDLDLGRSNLFVIPITKKLLTTPNRAMDEDIPYALDKHIPVLPILREAVDDELYSARFGELQYLNPLSNDQTEIPYEEKLKKYLESVLISKELADRIRHAFCAYIFLSYRKVDRAYANTLMRLIHSIPDCRDFAIWFDEFLTPGESFKANIEKALDDCKLFTLLVTKQLFKKRLDEKGKEVDNFVISNELPEAKRKRSEKGTQIFAVEMEDAGKDAPSRLEADEYIRYDDVKFHERLMAAIKKIKYDVVDTPEHAFLIGLAYLEGIDMEVDRERAVELIETAAEEDLAEAMEKLIRMHKDGVGVARDVDSVQKWSKRLAEHYFKRIFSKRGTIKSKKKLLELFSHYADEYFTETLKAFLIYVDDRLTEDVITQLYNLLMNQGIYEYTLFFEACKEMSEHKEQAQCALLRDIIQKSTDGTYPPYGPLFWYVPEYELYEPLLLTLDTIKDKPYFAKALALTRDVCWIFGRFNTAAEITDRVNGEALFVSADLVGVRRGLCELFFTGDTMATDSEDIYPRCFNIAEAKSWKECGQGVFGRMPTAFEDELGLYSHEMFSELGGEYTGVVAAPYDKERLETVLPQKSCKKMCGLFFSPTDKKDIEPLAINDRHVRCVYIPENFATVDERWKRENGLFVTKRAFLYFHSTICLPDSVTTIEKRTFVDCTSLTAVTISDNVTTIGMDAFRGCTSLISVTIPHGLMTIGEKAFRGCTALASVIIPNSVTTIGERAFMECSSLTTVTIPDSATIIERGAFWGCTSLTSVIIPNGVTKIEESVFWGCTSLISVTIPDGMTTIDWMAFADCASLASITIPDGVTKIGEWAFKDCISLVSITIPNGVTEIGASVFRGCISLTSVNIPDSVRVIEASAFEGCTSLASVTIPNGVITIGRCAFKSCTSLVSVIIPDGVTEIGESAFADCWLLRRIINCPLIYSASYLGAPEEVVQYADVKEEEKVFVVPPGTVTVTKDMLPENRRKLVEQIVFPDSVKIIRLRAFKDCISLTSVNIPDSVRIIEVSAFEGCTSLTSVTIPNGVITIGRSAFESCTSLVSVTLPNDVTEIGEGVFSDCRLLYRIINCPPGYSATYLGVPEAVVQYADVRGEDKVFAVPPGTVTVTKDTLPENRRKLVEQIAFPDDVKKIGWGAFQDCISLQSITIPDGVTTIDSSAFERCTALSSVTLPDSVTIIGGNAFSRCASLISIAIPDGVTIIGEWAFHGCTSLTSAIIPDGVIEIKRWVFRDCPSLSSITIPNSVTTIKGGAFMECTSLTSVAIPASVTTIEESAFEGCTSLSSITIPDGVRTIGEKAFCGCPSLESIIIPGGVTKIERCAFEGCASLTSITIPNSVTTIKGGAFTECTSLTLVTIPDNVREIGMSAFKSCISLASVTIPDNVREIGMSAFKSCTSLTSITISKRCQVIKDSAFKDCNSLMAITIPVGVTTVEESAFEGCTSLVSVTIPDGVTTIGRWVFDGCSSLASVTIPASVKTIGNDAFGGCTGLKEITISRRFEDDLERIFSGVDLSQVTIHWL